MKFFETFIKYRFLVLALFTLVGVLGYRAYKEIPVDAFPDITPKQVIIYTESPGNSPEIIERLITYPIESAMAGLPGVKLIMSNSIFGLSYVSIFFEDKYDIYFLRQLVSERLATVDIPKGFGKPVMGPNTTGLGQVFWYQLKGDGVSLTKLRELQDFLVHPMFKTVDGVEEVIGWGGFEKQIEVVIDPKKLQALKVTYEDVIDALQRTNKSAGGQYLEFNKEQYIIRGSGFYENLDQIRKSVIKSSGIKAIKIEDVAVVKEGKRMRFGAVTLNGKETMFGMVLQRTGTNAAKVVDRLKEKVKEINAALPKNVRVQTIYDRSEITKKAVHTMTSSLIMGAVLVSVILFLFLFEVRSAFIVVLSLPISLLIAFLMMDYFGMSANLMSLSGLAIAIGMIVDGTIVVVENSFRLIQEHPNESKLKLIAEAAAQVTKPVIFAIFIIAATFIPLLSLGGLTGKLYAPMAINIVFVMLASIVVALVLVPVLNYYLLKPVKFSESPLVVWIKKLYTPLLVGALKYSKSVVAVSFILFAVLAYLLTQQGREFMPKLNEESIMYRVIAIPGTALSQTVGLSKDIENFIKKEYPEYVDFVLAMIGRSEKGETAGPNYMEILVGLKKKEFDIKALEAKMSEELEKRYDFVQFVPTQPIAMRIEELLEGVKAELAVKIFGEDQKILANLASKIKDILSHIDGLRSIEIESQLGQAQIVIKPNYLAMARYSLTAEDIMDVVRYLLGEDAITDKFEGIKRFPIVIKPKGSRDVESLQNILLRAPDGKVARLKEVADIQIIQGPSFIKRENLSRYMLISFDVEGRDIASFVKEANEKIHKNLHFPAGYYIQWAGDFKNMQEATKKLAVIIPAVLLLILLLLYTAFNSFKKAIIILLGVPLGIIGSIIAVLVADIYLSIAAIIGFIVIIAIAVLNGIVLVSFIEELQKRFPDVKMLILVKDATLLRLRPVLMTAMTTLFGILPLLYATGVGSEIEYPLAVVVVGGIVTSTLVTLLVLPSLYYLFYKK
ncbi:efflux RND transporter permease subunit [Nitratiruptor sp. YY09-18]|uniref:efflux RND transporter permease subunit n=1 Tax=Nitratiruptor sp. YY09-18 TaxID=2724901 RepID=UPI0019169CA9|nr:CusA/CzcA family heavy metal efflux RND transporter [Nitratiruptor sp. YY09-18]BCD68160.1 cobalt-zinc-cadmium resistance protein CzcA [Nitratiruptor sp. YY09-18]